MGEWQVGDFSTVGVIPRLTQEHCAFKFWMVKEHCGLFLRARSVNRASPGPLCLVKLLLSIYVFLVFTRKGT